MSFTKPRDLLVGLIVAAGLVYLVAQMAYASLPPIPAPIGVILLILALVELLLGFSLRARIQRKPGTRPVDGVTAVRSVALAKASSLTGAILCGASLGLLGYVLPERARVQAAAQDTTAALIGLVGAAALVAAALWLEYCCRTPDDEQGSSDSDDGPDER